MSDSIRISPTSADTANWGITEEEDFNLFPWPEDQKEQSKQNNQSKNDEEEDSPDEPSSVPPEGLEASDEPLPDQAISDKSIQEIPGEFFPLENIEETIENNTLTIDDCVRFAEVSVKALLNGEMSALEQSKGWSKADLEEFAIHVAAKYDIDPTITLNQIETESHWNANLAGDTDRLGNEPIGLMQVSKGVLLGGEWSSGGISTLTLKWKDGRPMTCEEVWTPAGNILAGVQLLANIRDTIAGGDIIKALRYYISGCTKPNDQNNEYVLTVL